MNPSFVPSLQHIALAKIAVMLCNDQEIKTLVQKNRCCDPCECHGIISNVEPRAIHYTNYWSLLEKLRYPRYINDYSRHNVSKHILEKAQNKVSGMISPLNLGPSFEKEILNFIPHIILEIEKWEEDHAVVLPKQFDAQVYFCWTSVGTIHRESTVENLLNHGDLNVKNKFFLACWYCLENRVSSFWDGIYDTYKAHLTSKCHSRSLINYWTTRLDGLHSNRSAFPDAAYITNLSALRYFYNKCSSEDRKQAFLNDILSKHWKNLDMVQFCVSKVCENGHKQLSGLECHNILRCFLNWPLQSLFLDISMHLLGNLDQIEINDLLYDILRIVITCKYEDMDYLNLLKKLWEQIPSCHKDSLMDNPDFQPIKIALEQTSAKSLTPEWFYQQGKK